VSLELVPLCTMVMELGDPFVLPNSPAGTRVIVEMKDLRVEGDRLRGSLKGNAAADWLTIGPDATGTIDVRATMETHDGAVVFMHYQGRRDFSQGMDAPIYTAPKFDTGDDRYAWINKIQAVAKGTVEGATLTYEVFELR
jgi:hypothetical protein